MLVCDKAIPSENAIVGKASGLRSVWLIRGGEGYGVSRATLGLAAAFRSKGVQVEFVALSPGDLVDAVRNCGYEVRVLGCRSFAGVENKGIGYIVELLLQLGYVPIVSWRLSRLLRSLAPDWVHFRVNTLLIVAGLSCRIARVPVYWHIPNEIRNKLPFGLQAFGYRLAAFVLKIKVLANSQFTARSYGVGPGRSRVLYPGIDASHFSAYSGFQTVRRESLGFCESVPLFVISARLTPSKAQDRVVEAALALLQESVDLQVLVVGGPLETEFAQGLIERVNQADAGEKIKFIGQKDDPRPFYAIADVLINSRAGAEPFGLSIVEAMLMGKPVLGVRLGGPAESIIDGETGWLVEGTTLAHYKKGLARALGDRSQWDQFGAAGRDRAARLYTTDASALRYIDLLEEDGVLS